MSEFTRCHVEEFESISHAMDEGYFQWAGGCNHKGPVGVVYQLMADGFDGFAGFPGFAEVPIKWARLFAAAPELLAACEAALANMIDMCDTSENDMKVREQLAAAIEKARG